MRNKPRNIVSVMLVAGGVAWFWAKQIGLGIYFIADLFGTGDDLRSLWRFLVDLDINQIGPWFLIVGGIASLVWINAGPYLKAIFSSDQSDRWAQECETLATEMTDFIYERNTTAPASFPEEEKDVSDKSYHRFKLHADHSAMTRYLYARKFTHRLHDLVNCLRENGHKPAQLLTFGEDSWADKKIGKLTTYARLLREGKIINDDDWPDT